MQALLTRRIALYAVYLTDAANKRARGEIVEPDKTYYSVQISHPTLRDERGRPLRILHGMVRPMSCPDTTTYLDGVVRKQNGCDATGYDSGESLHMCPAALTEGMFLWAGGITTDNGYFAVSAFAELVDQIFARMHDAVVEGLTKLAIREVKARKIADLADLTEDALHDILDHLGVPSMAYMLGELDWVDAAKLTAAA